MLTPVFYLRVHNKRRGLCKQTETLPPSFKLKHSPVNSRNAYSFRSRDFLFRRFAAK